MKALLGLQIFDATDAADPNSALRTHLELIEECDLFEASPGRFLFFPFQICVDMHVDMYVDMCADMCADMCVDMCMYVDPGADWRFSAASTQDRLL